MNAKLRDSIISCTDTLYGTEATWVFWKNSIELTPEEQVHRSQLLAEQLTKCSRRVWMMNPRNQPIVFGHFELNDAFWNK